MIEHNLFVSVDFTQAKSDCRGALKLVWDGKREGEKESKEEVDLGEKEWEQKRERQR